MKAPPKSIRARFIWDGEANRGVVAQCWHHLDRSSAVSMRHYTSTESTCGFTSAAGLVRSIPAAPCANSQGGFLALVPPNEYQWNSNIR